MSIPREFREDFKDKEFAHGFLDEFLNVFIATQIKVLREERGLTQQQLADLSGMKQSRIALLENVNYSAWSINILRRLAKALDVALRVSFETFGNQSQRLDNLQRISLERTSREKEIELDELIEARLSSNPLLVNVTTTESAIAPSLTMRRADRVNATKISMDLSITSTASGAPFVYATQPLPPKPQEGVTWQTK